MPLERGERLGPYEILDVLGAGGMGVVYRAHDPRLGREVAIKVLPDELLLDASRLERFAREARAAGGLNHPNILSVHDVGEDAGRPYVVFELLDGDTLRGRLADGSLPPRRALDVALQVAQGLAAAHANGIVHRDLKPENVFLRRDGFVKILDFGLAKALGRDARGAGGDPAASTDSGVRLGTTAYLSPEQARGAGVDHRSDLFSLGIVIHEMLTGANPFRRPSSAETVAAILKEVPPPLPEPLTLAIPGLAPVLARCLANAPEERFQSTQDFAFALRQLAESTRAAEPPRPSRPDPRVRGVVWLALLALGIAGMVATRWTAPRPELAFRRLTTKASAVLSARFSPEGSSVLFTGRGAERGFEVYEQRLDALEPRVLDAPAGKLLAVAAGELAILSPARPDLADRVAPGTLLRVPIEGGAARAVAEGVLDADWRADGSAFAVVRTEAGRVQLEYPLGRRLYTSTGMITTPRISPDGRAVAFMDFPVRGHLDSRIGVVGEDAAVRFLTDVEALMGLAWSPDGRELWFGNCTRCESVGAAVDAVRLSGRRRGLLRLPDARRLLDVAADGRALIASNDTQTQTAGRLAGDALERDLTLRDATFLMDLAPDGSTMLFIERDVRNGRLSAYLRRAGDGQPVRLEQGEPQSLSPDGRRFTLRRSAGGPTLSVIPTGPGEALTLPRGTIADYYNSRWLPDGRRLLIAAQEQGRPKRLFVQDVAGGDPRPVTPEGVVTMYPAISPDGRWVAAGLEQETVTQAAWPLAGGEPRPLRGLEPGDWVVRWSADGRSVFAHGTRADGPPWPLHRIDLETGRRELWRELQPADPSGILSLTRAHVTPDGRWYAYTFFRSRPQLYLLSGLR